MRKDKLITDYTPWGDYELSTLAGRVLSSMEDPNMQNHFPAPDPNLVELRSIVEDYVSKHEIASRRGSALEITLKNEAREVVLKGLKRLAHHANGLAEGRTSILLSTGLVLYGIPKRSELPGIPQRVRFRDGLVSGQLRLDFENVAKTWEYEVEIGESEFGSSEIQWTRFFLTTSSRGNVLMDVVPGRMYYVRVRAKNGKGTGDWSATASLLAR